MNERAAMNTDREIYRERDGDYYADSIHVTKGGGIGINCGGMVYVKPIREWHRLAKLDQVDALRSEIAKPSVPNPCSVCGVPIFGSHIGTGDGSMKDGGSFAHPECYWRKQAQDAEITLRGWHEVFGTSQLTHALERLQKAEDQASRSASARKNGRTKLVYNKATRMIDQVRDGQVVESFAPPEELG